VFVGIGKGVSVGADVINNLGGVGVGGVDSGAGVQVTGRSLATGVSCISGIWARVGCSILSGNPAVGANVGRYARADWHALLATRKKPRLSTKSALYHLDLEMHWPNRKPIMITTIVPKAST